MTVLDYSSKPKPEPQAPPADDAEPWGQQGVLGHLVPALAKLCIFCAFIGCLLWNRSWSLREGFAFEPPRRSVELTSVVGRVRLVVAPRGGTMTGGSELISHPAPSLAYGDPWEPGIMKTIGVGTSVEAYGKAGVPATVLRIRWRTIVGVLLLFPVIYYYRQWRASRSAEAAV